jgi:two-component system, sensor histidine kinase PdtaS
MSLRPAPDSVNQQREWKTFVSELRHRLRNNLQMITSVIALQESRISDPQVAAAVRATHNRVRAIAGVFGPNSNRDLTTVHFGEYLPSMIRELAAEYGVSDRVEIQIRTADMAVDIDKAIPLALIANELAANALEHGFPGDARGKMCVGLSYAREPAEESDPEDEHGILEIADDGAPLPPSFAFEAAESTGFYLVRTLTSQLQARMTVAKHASGKTFRLTFPIGN